MGSSVDMKTYIDEAEAALLHTYNRYQIVFDKGEGVHWDTVIQHTKRR